MADDKTISITTAKHEMAVYCKQLHDRIPSLSTSISGDVDCRLIYQEKCTQLCEKIDDHNSEIMTETDLHKSLQAIAQLVLDVTFLEEKSLIGEDFSNKSSFCRVWNVIDTLQSVEDLAKHTVQDKSVVDTLSSEIIECLQWRKGALLYMYCHTINAQFSLENLPIYFRQEYIQRIRNNALCLEDGIKYLTSMFCARSSPKWLSNVIVNRTGSDSEQEADDKASILLAQGIYSDTHLLALMYCGELCYWHTKLRRLPDVCEHMKESKPGKTQSDAVDVNSVERHFLKDCSEVNASPDAHNSLFASESLKCDSSYTFYAVSKKHISSPSSITASNVETKINIVNIGKSCLENYISAARGPLVFGGWKTTRAEEILQYFYNLK